MTDETSGCENKEMNAVVQDALLLFYMQAYERGLITAMEHIHGELEITRQCILTHLEQNPTLQPAAEGVDKVFRQTATSDQEQCAEEEAPADVAD